MATVTEYLQGIEVSRDALRALGTAMAEFVKPYDETVVGAEQERAEFGPTGVQVRVNSYSVESMTVNDGQAVEFTETTFQTHPPASATSWNITFYAWGTRDDRYLYFEHPYLQVEAYPSSGANLTTFGAGQEAVAILNRAKQVLSAFPAEADTVGVSPLRVFVAHGGDRQWEVVRDYLANAEIDNVAFESDERAGYATLETVAQMIHGSTVSVCVMTAADQMASGAMHARENVIHEIGFSQGALGVANTIILLENGAHEFTNIAGLTQIRFDRGEIHTTRERVLAALEARRQQHQFPMGGC